jgi:tRNA-Thr(GGU) m(6)t(6)A37 methyltransferase TsaA
MSKNELNLESAVDFHEPRPEGRKFWQFASIGIMNTCFKEKFGIPRQSGLAPSAEGTLSFLPPFDQPEMVRELEDFSHVWVLFVFHTVAGSRLKATVRPPRLGGQRRVGVLASRSGYRPNPIGMSVMELAAIAYPGGRPELHLRGVDLLDGTPVLDVKPYLPYTDDVPRARGGFAAHPPDALTVTFSPRSRRDLARQRHTDPQKFTALIREVLSQNPRPAHERKRDCKQIFGMRLWNFNVRWQVVGEGVRVISVTQLDPG